MLAAMPKAVGTKGQIIGGSRGKAIITGDTSVVSPVNGTKTLKEMGITLNQSSRWQKIAAIPDDAAYMELVKSNNQGELLALEIGLHALATVNDKTKKGGGIRAYAEEIGKGEVSVTEWTKAASVYMFLSRTCETNGLSEKTKHLYEISKAPEASWQVLADLLIECDWTVKDTQAAVNRIKAIVLHDWMELPDNFYRRIATIPAFAENTRKLWIIENQEGRRNLTDAWKYQLKQTSKAILREMGKAKIREAGSKHKGNQYTDKLEPLSTIDKGSNSSKEKHNTREIIAEELGWSTGKVAMADRVFAVAASD